MSLALLGPLMIYEKLDSCMKPLDFLNDGMLIKFSVKPRCNERVLYTISHQGNVNENHNEIPLYTYQLAKTDNIECWL